VYVLNETFLTNDCIQNIHNVFCNKKINKNVVHTIKMLYIYYKKYINQNITFIKVLVIVKYELCRNNVL